MRRTSLMLLERGQAVFMTAIGITALACGGGGASSAEQGASSTASSTGSTSTSSSSGASSSSSGSGVGGAASSSSSSSSSSSTGAGGSGPYQFNPKKRGSVSVLGYSVNFGKPVSGYVAQAQFDSYPDAGADVCTDMTLGACFVRTCTTLGSLGMETPESAGIVTITGGKQIVTLTPDATGTYGLVNDMTKALGDGGETITISAAGATVPAFSAMGVAPVGGDISSPPPPAQGQPLLIDRTQDLVFTWTKGGAGDITVAFGPFAPSNVGVGCTFASGAGTGTIPKAVLAALPAGQGGFFELGAGSSQYLNAGDWSVSVGVTTLVTWGGGPNLVDQFLATN